MRLTDLAKITGVALEDLTFVRDACRLPFTTVAGHIYVQNSDIPAWQERCRQILGGDD
jgi:hypothetical protein